MSQAQIGAALGVSQVTVSHNLKKEVKALAEAEGATLPETKKRARGPRKPKAIVKEEDDDATEGEPADNGDLKAAAPSKAMKTAKTAKTAKAKTKDVLSEADDAVDAVASGSEEQKAVSSLQTPPYSVTKKRKVDDDVRETLNDDEQKYPDCEQVEEDCGLCEAGGAGGEWQGEQQGRRRWLRGH